MSNKLVTTGDTISLHYKGTLSDGEVFDSSYDRGQTIRVTVGSGQLIAGFDSALVGMEEGTTKTVVLAPAEAYGDRDDGRIAEVSKDIFPNGFADQITEGTVVPLSSHQHPGLTMPATALEVKESTIVFDLNHPLAGQELTFDIEVVEIEAGPTSDVEADEPEGTTETATDE